LGEPLQSFGKNLGAAGLGYESGARRQHGRAAFIFCPCEKGARVAKVTTVLFAVREGESWRVQIVWPNGRVHYFGQFASEKDARAWISAHAWLTVLSKKKDDD
jgi:hypothetical protein